MIVQMTPTILKTHLQLNARTLITYEALKAERIAFVEARASQSSSSNDGGLDLLGKGKGDKG